MNMPIQPGGAVRPATVGGRSMYICRLQNSNSKALSDIGMQSVSFALIVVVLQTLQE